MVEKIVIIGGGAGGCKTAAKLRRENPSVKIDLYTDEDVISYSACGLPYYIEGIIKSHNTLIIRTPEDFEQQNISIHLKHKCTNINTKSKQIKILKLNTNEEIDVSYDILVIATGASPNIPEIKNINVPNIYALSTISDGIKIREKMLNSKKALILGGGYICIEMLEAFVHNGLDVTVIEKNPTFLKVFDDDFSQIIKDAVIKESKTKVEILTNEEIQELVKNDKGEVYKAITKSNKEIEMDFVLLATGVHPNTDFLTNTDIKLGVNNAIKVSNTLKTSKAGIYAVGDCCEKFNLITNRNVWIPLGSTANKEGRCAAINIAGNNCYFKGILNSTITKYFDYTIAIIGLSYKEACNLGFQPEFATVTKRDRAGYMPSPETFTLKLIADKNTRMILGLQAFGKGNVNQRINAVIPAIFSRTKIDDFMNLDIPYAPPFSPSIDSVLNAAQILYKKLNS